MLTLSRGWSGEALPGGITQGWDWGEKAAAQISISGARDNFCLSAAMPGHQPF
jgi:hypothetical protein